MTHSNNLTTEHASDKPKDDANTYRISYKGHNLVVNILNLGERNCTFIMSHGGTKLVFSVQITEGIYNQSHRFNIQYIEKAFAVHKIPAGFLKKELRKDYDIIAAKYIETAIQSLVPEPYKVTMKIVLLNFNPHSMHRLALAITGASLGLYLSGLPHNMIVASEIYYNPTTGKWSNTTKDKYGLLLLAGNTDGVVFLLLHNCPVKPNALINGITEIKNVWSSLLHFMFKIVSELSINMIVPKEQEHVQWTYSAEEILTAYLQNNLALQNKFIAQYKNKEYGAYCLKNITQSIVRQQMLWTNKRVLSKRSDMNDIKSIQYECTALNNNMFKIEDTIIFTALVKGQSNDKQILDTLHQRAEINLISHYTSYSYLTEYSDEVLFGRMIFNALQSLIPTDVVYRLNTEVLMNDEASCMNCILAGYLSLFAHDVTHKDIIAGVSIGLVQEGLRYKFLADLNQKESDCINMQLSVVGHNNTFTEAFMHVTQKEIPWYKLFESINFAFNTLEKVVRSIDEKRQEIINNKKQNKNENSVEQIGKNKETTKDHNSLQNIKDVKDQKELYKASEITERKNTPLPSTESKYAFTVTDEQITKLKELEAYKEGNFKIEQNKVIFSKNDANDINHVTTVLYGEGKQLYQGRITKIIKDGVIVQLLHEQDSKKIKTTDTHHIGETLILTKGNFGRYSLFKKL